MARHPLACVLVGSALAVAATFSSTSAHAKPKLGLDGEVAVPLTPNRVSTGGGGALRFGYELDAVLLTITPEVAAGYYSLGGDLAPKMWDAVVGGRLAVGALVRAVLFGHFGYGHVKNNNAPSRSAAAVDGGLALDLTVLPIIDIGVHAQYHLITGNSDGPANGWLGLGLHIQIAF
ncbi:hypothetical protein [Labilithrix luteola]|uniref:hypothetical protein n=1 Tax=Labilithrix luteola TaxID=1391654 RepID=UPI0011BA5BCE|nr:hypothetical protein [Labilithrix luteola]